MLWEKKNIKNPEKRGYLYLRETIYVRDKRTHKRKPKKLGSGSGYKERGKYSKKKDIYCGKIIECSMKKFLSFKEFIERQNKEYLEYKLNTRFDDIIDDFITYLIHVYEIDSEEFIEKKKAYELGTGFLSKETISFLKRFAIRPGFDEKKEIERFAFRCEDSGIYDNEVIITLFMKIAPEVSADVRSEIEKIKNVKIEEKDFKSFDAFLRKQHDMK